MRLRSEKMLCARTPAADNLATHTNPVVVFLEQIHWKVKRAKDGKETNSFNICFQKGNKALGGGE